MMQSEGNHAAERILAPGVARRESGEFFGLWGLEGRLASIVGPLTAGGTIKNGRRRALVCLAIMLCMPVVHAQQLSPESFMHQTGLPGNRACATDTDFHCESGQHRHHINDFRHTQQRTLGIVIANTLAVGLYGRSNWWQDGFKRRFRTANEGWFGQHTYSGGADKLGHFYMNYAGTRLFARAFEWGGNEPDWSLKLAAGLTLGTFTAVEIIDGFSKRWRFSKEDAIMNAAGVGAALLLERNPQLERLLDLRLLYEPSRDEHSNFDPFGDYSGQTYLLVAKASGVPALRNHPWLRYVEVALGYGARGYSANPVNGRDARSRHAYLGISLNLSELLGNTVFKHASEQGRVQRATDTFLKFMQVPGTAALARHKLDSN